MSVNHPPTPPEDLLWTVDELVRRRSREDPGIKLVAYPSKDTDYVDYTARQLDMFAFQTAQHYAQRLPPRQSSAEKPLVVGLLGPSHLTYLVSALALTKLGITVLFLSTRLSDAGYANLLESSGCQHLVVDQSIFEPMSKRLSGIQNLATQLMATNNVFLGCLSKACDLVDTRMDNQLDPRVENTNVAWIIHSSGSTGLPKPIFITHAAALRNYSNNFAMKGFITLPFFHAHGISSFFRSVMSKKQIHIYPANLPMTGPTLLKILSQHDFEIFYGVPYALKLLSETDQGLNILSRLKLVMFGGSSCPDQLGDDLVHHGVKLVSHYGSTETGQLMTSFRPDGDLDWNYLRVQHPFKSFAKWEERGSPDLFELVVLPGWPSKVATNRPDGAYATKDLFTKHPTKTDCYKWIGRIDDTLVLLNGEKANPIPIGHAVREHPAVAEVVVFGAGKPQTGMIIIPQSDMPIHNVMAQISSTVEAANLLVPAYARVDPEMIHILPYGTQYPKTDKSTVIRAAFYKQFATTIEQIYEQASGPTSCAGETLPEEELLSLLRATVTELMNLEDTSLLQDSTDLFSLGMDSLQALRAHSVITKKFNTNGQKIGQNVVFEHPTLQDLTKYLMRLAAGHDEQAQDPKEIMAELVKRYNTFTPHTPGTSTEAGAILVTGATGSLGAHVVSQLVRETTTNRVYCLVRAKSTLDAQQRVIDSLVLRRLYHDLTPDQQRKIEAVPSLFGQSNLGLPATSRTQMLASVTAIIHLAWAVNFNWDVQSFEPQHIAGTHHLLQFALSSTRPQPPSFYFGSSISAVAATPTTRPVAEALDGDFSHAQGMGYARSKLVTEVMVGHAARHLGVAVLRIGQIAASTRHGVWPATEAIPLLIRSATTLRCLPALDDDLAWLPVDAVARVVLELCYAGAAGSSGSVYHVVNPATLHWTRELLPLLRAAGLEFETVGRREWVCRLAEEAQGGAAEGATPAAKLLGFFEGKYGGEEVRKGLVYETERARGLSPTLGRVGRLDLGAVRAMVKYWREECWGGTTATTATEWGKRL